VLTTEKWMAAIERDRFGAAGVGRRARRSRPTFAEAMPEPLFASGFAVFFKTRMNRV
jgi:hypothetical protein